MSRAEARGARGIAAMALAQLAGAGGVLLGAAGLRDLLLGGEWWGPLVTVVAVVTGLGLLGTVTRARWWLVALGQVLALLLTAGWLVGEGELVSLIGEGFNSVAYSTPPAEMTSPLLALVLVSFGAVTVAIDACVRTVPALAGTALLAVVVTTMTIAEPVLPLAAVLGPAAAFLLILALTATPKTRSAGGGVTQKTRSAGGGVTQKARSAGGGVTQKARSANGEGGVGVGGVVGVAGTLAGILVLGGAALAGGALAPRLSPGLSTVGIVDRTPVSDGRIGVSPVTALTGDLLRSEERPILELRSGDDSPLTPDYLRAAVLTDYIPGAGWATGELRQGEPPEGESAEAAYDRTVEVVSTGYAGWFLPVPDATTAMIEPTGIWSFYADLGVWRAEQARDPGQYLVGVHEGHPTAEELLVDTVNPTEEELTLDGVPVAVVELAAAIAPQESPFERARALQDWFLDPANDFTYSLSVPEGDTGDPLLDFLEQRVGYCEQYASTMAVLARAVGLPARVVVGYGPGTPGAEATIVSTHDAHAWVEVRFESAGWVRFEPTPPDGTVTRLGGFTTPEPTQEVGPDVDPSAPAEAPSPTSPEEETGGSSAEIDDEIPAGSPGSAAASSAGAGWWWAAVGGVVLIAAIGPSAERARRRRARLRPGKGVAVGAWEELEALAADHLLALPADASPREKARDLGTVVARNRRVRDALDLLVAGVERAWYAPSEAGPPGAAAAARTDAASAVASVRAALARTRPRRGVARWLPASLLPSRVRAWLVQRAGAPIRH